MAEAGASSCEMDDEKKFLSHPPEHGLKLKLNHVYPVKVKPKKKPKFRQALPFIPLSFRYAHYCWKVRRSGRKPFMDFLNIEKGKPIYGVPLGGIGGGSIGRGFRGEFCRYQLCPGMYEFTTVPENQFIINIRDENDNTIFQSLMSTYEKPKKWSAPWRCNLRGQECEYLGLYPRAWTSYDLSQFGVKVVCRQISPVIPHNYKDSSLPCGVFVWEVTNVGDKRRSVSITLTFKNVTTLKDKRLQDDSINFERYTDDSTCGMALEQSVSGMGCTFTLAKHRQPQDSSSDGFCKFNFKKGAAHVWKCLESKGRLIPSEIPTVAPPNTMGLSSQIVIEPGCNDIMEFCLVWDMPTIHFGKKTRKYNRYYTRFFGSEGIAGPSIASYSLSNYAKWEQDIIEWQAPILDDESLPSWYKSALMNELYYVSDGGTIWLDVSDDYPKEDPRWSYGMFGYLEGHEYRMYNTYDVHFYASFALAQLWPRLQITLQYQFKEAIKCEIKKRRKHLFCGTKEKRKVMNSVPHDLGDPDEEPFLHINAYNIHDVSQWRDLNLKFILQVFRDLTFLKAEKDKITTMEKYQSLEYIDDPSEAHEELYVRSTNQTSKPVHNKVTPILVSTVKTGNQNGYAMNSESDVKMKVPPREKHISISSVEFPDEDLPHGRFHSFVRQNSSGKAFLSQSSEALMEELVIEDVVDAERFLQDMYPVCRDLLETMLSWDADSDGLIENTGSPDQTFDAWIMTGPSAYCAGLWLSGLQCMLTMAASLHKQQDVAMISRLLTKGTKTLEKKLWNGKFYEFDANNHVIMADQLCGHWYLRACGYQYPVYPQENVKTALKVIYENNVLKFCDGKMGAVNGYIPGDGSKQGRVDYVSLQSEESWTGVTYALAALMIHEGLREQAFSTAGGMYLSLRDRFGLSFQTPEAIYETEEYRSIGYMRPLSIWAMHHALQNKPAVNQ